MTETTSRPTRMPRAERRVQLMDVARAVFAEQGYAGAAMDEIAARAQVSKPVLYQHFSGKHELFLALLDGEVTELDRRLTAAIEGTGDNRMRAHGTVHAVFAYMDTPERSHRLIFESGAEHDPEVQCRVEAVRESIAAQITRILSTDTVVEGVLAQVVARGVVEMVLGAARHWADHVHEDRRPTAQDTAEAVEQVLWLGLEAIPDRPVEGRHPRYARG